jgi:tetratricopeptide (TPR) repeat protein
VVRATAGDLQEALADANRAVELCQSAACDDLPNILDTRGYAFLKLARYRSALEDYQQALDSGSQYPTVLLGRGLAHAALGENDQALDDLKTLRDPVQVRVAADPELKELVLQARQTLTRLQNGK